MSKSRIRRLRKAGRFPNAWKDDQHDWLVPVKDLQAVELLPSMDVTSAQRRPEGDPPPSPPDAPQPAETSISASEQQRREQIVRSIRAASAPDGSSLRETVCAVQDQWVRGEITTKERIRRVRELVRQHAAERTPPQ